MSGGDKYYGKLALIVHVKWNLWDTSLTANMPSVSPQKTLESCSSFKIMRGQTALMSVSRGTTSDTEVDPQVVRKRIEDLRELIDDLIQQAAGVATSLEVLALFGLPAAFPTGQSELDFYSAVRHFESFLIRNALQHTRGSQVQAARLLCMADTTLNAKIKTLKINSREYAIAIGSQRKPKL
jgi:hypothetical protein